ncbi:proliferation-associated protein 2G4-like isoform X2 [Lineus longissimus]
MKKGIAFPVCISVNNCICHFTPIPSEPDSNTTLADGDLVKIDLGAHIDGFPALVAHTLVIGATKENKVTGRKADVIVAAHKASEAALRLVKPGIENMTVTDTIQKVADEFECKPIAGMLSYQLQQHRIDGEKSIIQNPDELQRKDLEKVEFEQHEVYGVDILISTGDGKGKDIGTRTTVHKKKVEESYSLKLKSARHFFSEATKKFGVMPFTIRGAGDDEKKTKMGLKECVTHGLFEEFRVLWEKEGDYVAQFKFTVLLMPKGPMKITGGPFDLELYESEHSIKDPELKTLLASSANPKNAKKKKKKAEKEMTSGMSTETTASAET